MCHKDSSSILSQRFVMFILLQKRRLLSIFFLQHLLVGINTAEPLAIQFVPSFLLNTAFAITVAIAWIYCCYDSFQYICLGVLINFATLWHNDCVRKFEGKMLTRIDFVCFVDFPGLIMTKRQVFVFGFLPCKTMYSVNKQNVTNHNYQVRRNKHSGTRHVFYTLEKIFIWWIAK